MRNWHQVMSIEARRTAIGRDTKEYTPSEHKKWVSKSLHEVLENIKFLIQHTEESSFSKCHPLEKSFTKPPREKGTRVRLDAIVCKSLIGLEIEGLYDKVFVDCKIKSSCFRPACCVVLYFNALALLFGISCSSICNGILFTITNLEFNVILGLQNTKMVWCHQMFFDPWDAFKLISESMLSKRDKNIQWHNIIFSLVINLNTSLVSPIIQGSCWDWFLTLLLGSKHH